MKAVVVLVIALCVCGIVADLRHKEKVRQLHLDIMIHEIDAAVWERRARKAEMRADEAEKRVRMYEWLEEQSKEGKR